MGTKLTVRALILKENSNRYFDAAPYSCSPSLLQQNMYIIWNGKGEGVYQTDIYVSGC